MIFKQYKHRQVQPFEANLTLKANIQRVHTEAKKKKLTITVLLSLLALLRMAAMRMFYEGDNQQFKLQECSKLLIWFRWPYATSDGLESSQ